MKPANKFLFLLLFFALALTSCVSTKQNVAGDTALINEAIQSNESIVFGNILWIEKGKQKEIGSGIFDFYVKPDLLRLEDKSRIICDVGKNGDFVWTLKPGTYVINKMQYRDTWSGNYFFVPHVAFRIKEDGETFYIGQLEVNFEPKRDLIGGMSGKAKFTVNDNSPESYERFSQDSNINKESIQKSLMIHDTRLPTTFDTTAEFNIGMQLINAILSAM